MRKPLPLLALLALLSCAHVQETDFTTVQDGIDFTLVAESAATRTTNEGAATRWAAGDALTAFHAASGARTFRPESFTYSGTANDFNGQVSQLAEVNDWYLFYPHDARNASAEEVHISVPSVQTQAGNDSRAHLAGPSFPLVGKQLSVPAETVPTVPMRNALSVLAYHLVNETDSPLLVKEIVLTAPCPVAGDFAGDLTAEDLRWNAEGTSSSELRLAVADGTPIPAGGSAAFYAGTVPFSVAPGGRLKLKVTAIHPATPFTDIDFYHVYELASGTTCKTGSIKPVEVRFDGRHQWDPDGPAARTYRDVTAIEPGTYVIVGYEPPRSGLDQPGTYVCVFPPCGDNLCDHVLVSADAEIDTFTSDDPAVLASEVELIACGDGWLVRTKESGRYLYYRNGSITYTDEPSFAVQTISKGYSKYWVMSMGNNQFYHSGSSRGFLYAYRKNANNLRFFRLAEGGKRNQALSFGSPVLVWTLGEDCVLGGDYPVQTVANASTPVTYSSSDPAVVTVEDGQLRIQGAGTATISAVAEENDQWNAALATYTLTVREPLPAGVYSLENDQVAGYLDAVEARPYDPSDYSVSYITDYCGDTDADNRLDWPKPVPVHWETAGADQLLVFNDAARTDLELTVPVGEGAFSADVYNLIPELEYYYTVAGNGAGLETGSFRTEGRRRMIKAGSDCGKQYANNLRDLGGQETVDGRKLRYGKVFRGSNMDSISDEARAVLKDYLGIGLDVDLREDTGANPLDIPVSDETYNSFGDLSNPDKMTVTLTDIFTAVADGTVVYVHCSVGTDRTGYVCMILEALLGVPQGWCDVDYELSSFSWAIEGPRNRIGLGNYYYRSGRRSNGEPEVRGVDYISTFPGDTFQEKATYYVVDVLGIPAETVEAFRNAML